MNLNEVNCGVDAYRVDRSASSGAATDVIIYVLCFDTTTYEKSLQIYATYSWAKPIIIKYQDYTFENAFWKQMLEISDEWEKCDMVGTISHKAHTKINIGLVDNIITNKLYLPNNYYYWFYQSTDTLFNDTTIAVNTPDNEKCKILINYMSENLNNTTDCTISFCNYWMTTPMLMKHFINWHINVCLPLLLNHPLCFDKYTYTPSTALSEERLIQLWGKPYYPMIPFVFERINSIFFYNLDK
jgi:hypothetical protein